MKNLEEFKNQDKIKEILDTQKSEKNTHLFYIRRKYSTTTFQM